MNPRHIVFAALALSTVCGSATALPNLITNGGFESDNFGSGFTTITSGLTGWTIDYGSIDGINSYWQPAEGKNSIDLFGNSRGKISQVINTVVGQQYTVTYYQSYNPDFTDNTRTLLLGVNGDNIDTTINQLFNFSTVRTRSNMQWEFVSTGFTAQDALTTISFRGGSTADNEFFGPAMDDVVITGPAAVPLPGVLGLMLVGLAGIGFSNKKRQSALANQS